MNSQQNNALAANVFSATCPARQLLGMLADKWALLLMHSLATQGPARTAELRRRVEGISEKMLIQTLRRLAQYGLVHRQAYPEVPPRVVYRLTDTGASLSVHIQALDRWVEENAVVLSQGYEAAISERVSASPPSR
uniref:winged helix-turn-helix transcriptional regulator n=1 Tax=Pantoea sp. IMH TaxID=1267600 RepID=UPI00046A726B|nr:helix-turn-helix domain-containing protein [Pantoea sp. IMH]